MLLLTAWSDLRIITGMLHERNQAKAYIPLKFLKIQINLQQQKDW